MIGRIILLLALTAAGVYFAILTALFLGLFRIKRAGKKQGNAPVFVSVVVPVRDEEKHLSACLESLLNQTYLNELYEVILVNDRSTDNTAHIARSFAERDNRLKLLNSAERDNITGKQRALDTGIRASKGEIILLTDADCKAPPEWIENTVREYEDDVGLVAGFAILKEENSNRGMLWRALFVFQSIDVLSNYAVSIGSMALGIAWTCTGNNLTFRREVYDQLGGFDALGFTSTEDTMLLQWVDRRSRWKVKPMLNVVYTKPSETVAEFTAQRIRWVSNSFQYRPSVVFFSVIAYCVNLFLPFLIGLCVFRVISYEWLILFLGLKIVPEFLMVYKSLRLFYRTDLLKYFPLIQPFHVIYILVFGIRGLSGRFTWKGRRYSEGKAGNKRRER